VPPGRPATSSDRRRLARAEQAASPLGASRCGAGAKKRTTVAVAVARELACFVWEIAQQPD